MHRPLMAQGCPDPHLPARGVGTRCGIVVDVAVERPQLIGEAAET